MNIIVDNLDTHVEVSGGGLAMLMVHGWKDNLNTFDALTNELQNDFKIIRIDLPGFGRSQMPPEAWDVSQYAEFIKKVLLKLEETELYAAIGHSMGGRILMNAIGRRVLDPAKLVLIASAGIPDTGGAKKATFSIIAKGGKLVASVLPKSQQDKLKSKLYKMADSDYGDAGELGEIFKKMVTEDSRKYAPNVHPETLLIYSSNDKLTPPSFGEEFKKLIPNSRLEIPGSYGHNIHKNKPEVVLKLLRDFL